MIIKYILILIVAIIIFILTLKLFNVLSITYKTILLKAKTKTKEKFNLSQLFVILKSSPKSIVAIMLRLIVSLLFFILSFLMFKKIVFALLFAIAGYLLPGYLIKRSKKKLFEKFEEQLVDGLGIIANSLRAGASLLQAIEVMVKNSEPPLAEEFGEALKQIHLGTPIEEALNNITLRVASKDLHLTVITINVAKEFGGNLSENLIRIATVMRERKKIQSKINAITSQGRLSGWLITFVPIGLFFVLRFMEPQLFDLMLTTTIGNILLGIVILMVSLGNYIIMKIVTIDI